MLDVRQCEDVTVVRPEMHRLDEMLGRQLISAMREYALPRSKIVLNLADVTYLNSEAVGYISTFARRLSHHQGGVAVCCLQEGPRGVFHILRMDRILAGIYDSEEEAMASFKEPARK